MMKYYLESEDAVVKELKSSYDGLSSAEASRRLSKLGKNKLDSKKKEGIVKSFFRALLDPMIIMLLIAAGISTATAIIQNESFTDLFIILFVVVINTVLSVFQERKAEHAIEALKELTAATCTVIRDKKTITVKSEDVTIGDVVLLEAGNQVPADCRIIESYSLKADESGLTGESVSIGKLCGVLSLKRDKGDIPLGDRKNMLFSGSTIVYGRGKAIVTDIGMNTEMGKIAGALNDSVSEQTPLQKKMSELSSMLTRLVVIISMAVFVFGILRSGTFNGKIVLDTFLMSIALAVAAIPEGLPAVVTIILSVGVTSMSKKNALIRKLSAVETLGSTQIICTDKTGTLTKNKMTVTDVYTADDDMLMKAMLLCVDAKPDTRGKKAKINGEPTETALVEYALSKGLSYFDINEKYKRVFEIPFESERKMMTVLCAAGGSYIQLTKGACEVLLKRCDRFLDFGGRIVAMSASQRHSIEEKIKGCTGRALRVLGFAFAIRDSVPSHRTDQSEDIENRLVFVGFAGMMDPCRPEVRDALVRCKSAGIRTIMITGDHKDTAVAIGKSLGIITNESEAMSGSELDMLDEAKIAQAAEKCSVFARVQPEHKTKIVKALKSKGYVVAMTGDGINDAPSIKSADIGISMGVAGTDVTKGVSDMVLADDNFATIESAVEEGRRIYDNVKKVIQFQLSTNMAEVVVICASSLMGLSILSPSHLLWINMVTDCAPGLALGMEKIDNDVMKRKPRDSKESVFSDGAGADMIIQGLFMSALIFLSFFVGQVFEFGRFGIFSSSIGASMAFLTTNFTEIFHAVCMRSRREFILKIKHRNLWLTAAFLLTTILTLGVIRIEFFAGLFEFAALNKLQVAVSIGIAFLIVPFVELTKLIQKIIG
mgnify:CR=1 FL=1